jgi:4-hydroxybenzoate polyprenyltransferase
VRLAGAVALAWVFFYSYTKRFTAWAHHVLGVALGIAPAGAYLAISGAWPEPWYALPVLGGGRDVLGGRLRHHLRRAGRGVRPERTACTRCRPATGRAGRSRWRACSTPSRSLLFAAVGLAGLFPVGPLYLGGLAVMAALLVYEHRLIGRGGSDLDLARIDRAFFHANVAVSCPSSRSRCWTGWRGRAPPGCWACEGRDGTARDRRHHRRVRRAVRRAPAGER